MPLTRLLVRCTAAKLTCFSRCSLLAISVVPCLPPAVRRIQFQMTLHFMPQLNATRPFFLLRLDELFSTLRADEIEPSNNFEPVVLDRIAGKFRYRLSPAR